MTQTYPMPPLLSPGAEQLLRRIFNCPQPLADLVAEQPTARRMHDLALVLGLRVDALPVVACLDGHLMLACHSLAGSAAGAVIREPRYESPAIEARCSISIEQHAERVAEPVLDSFCEDCGIRLLSDASLGEALVRARGLCDACAPNGDCCPYCNQSCEESERDLDALQREASALGMVVGPCDLCGMPSLVEAPRSSESEVQA